MTTTTKLEYTETELLASHDYAEALVAAGRTCHGGFLTDGSYQPPRTLHREPAIEAWQQSHTNRFGTQLLDLPLDTWPRNFPNVAQAKYLLSRGVTEPIISTLTRIGTVEGFGGFLRFTPIPDWDRVVAEDLAGTATAHLDRGLIEAHARDEAGFGDQAGHNQMWFAIRDIAFDNPVTEDQTKLMLESMGIVDPGGGMPDFEKLREAAMATRLTPADVDFTLEAFLQQLTRLLLIEISAFHVFAWAEEVLADPEVAAGDGEAARLVSYIRADETPHVGYIKTVLSELRDRTIVGDEYMYLGREIVDSIWDAALDESLNVRWPEGVDLTMREIEHAVEGRPDRDALLEGFHALGSIRPDRDGHWIGVHT
ncbi:MAG: hypothetical protein JJLCMIEE_02881 [Acidimicrobiales bacterium]|nr:MAG: hypothetical protein EDR02_15020 [Actinomycetota bacterium]MBV6509782.1 hypothetical protein [Acidimicrobiales bacterium]RIK04383.1 MAG: hypothetical protein DCC48_13465 [Acidobacteriota bacterium]